MRGWRRLNGLARRLAFPPLSVQDGAILPQVTQINIEGIKPSDEQVTAINQRIAERVTRRADKEGRQITVKSVNVTGTLVEVVFNVKRT